MGFLIDSYGLYEPYNLLKFISTLLYRFPMAVPQPDRTVRLSLNAKNIEQYRTMETHRLCDRNHVKRILRGLEETRGRTFGVVHISIQRDGTKVIDDGQHRFDAIRAYLERHPDRTVEIWAALYEGLSERDETELHQVLNSVRTESTDDFLRVSQKYIPFWNKVRNNGFPIKVGLNLADGDMKLQTAIQLLKLFGSLDVKKAISMSSVEKADFAKSLADDELENLYRHLRDFVSATATATKIIQGPEWGTYFRKSYMMLALGEIYARNVLSGNFEPEEYTQRLSKILGSPKWVQTMSLYSTGYTGVGMRIEETLAAMNKGEHKNFK